MTRCSRSSGDSQAGDPVATVAVSGARNAGLLAVRILRAAESSEGAALRARLVSFAKALSDQARAKGAALRDRRTVGFLPNEQQLLPRYPLGRIAEQRNLTRVLIPGHLRRRDRSWGRRRA